MDDRNRKNDDDRTRTFTILTAGTEVQQYRIVEKIGAGGMGEVYLAEDTTLNRRVALKFLPARQNDNQDYRARFVREARAAAALNHPNIVHIYEVSEYQGRPFFAMEHIDGQSLYYYAHEMPQPINWVIDTAIQICQGLQKAHNQGIVHRDIKTDNIVIDSDGTAKILDFGLATIKGDQRITRAGSTLGTVAYMSPEQAEGKPVDQRSDLFSLGVVLYELVTGRTPFRRETETATMNAIVHDQAEPLARFKTNVPDGLQMIVDKLTEKDPQIRYQTAGDLLADLTREKRLLNSGTPSSPSRRNVRTVSTTGSRNRRLAFSGLALIVIVALALTLKPWKLEFSADEEVIAGEARLAVMYFDNLADPEDSQRLGEIVTNLLITDLSESDGLVVLSSQRLYDLLAQLGKEDARSIDRQTATQVAQRAHARWMLTGTILQTKPTVVITAQVVDVNSGQIEASQRVVGSPGQPIFEQINRLSVALREDLALAPESDQQDRESLADVMTDSEEAYRLYLEGIELRRQFFAEMGHKRFLKAIELDSNFAMAYYEAARADFGSPQSKWFLEMAVKKSEHTTPLQRLYIMAASYLADNQIDRSIRTLEQIIDKYPDEKEVYAMLARRYLAHKSDPSTALQYWNKVIDLDPLDKNAYNNLAYTYRDLGQIDQALDAIERYITLAPDEPNPYDSKGEFLAHAGRIDEAIEAYRTAIEKAPRFTVALRNLFHCFLFADRPDSARALIKMVTDTVQGEALLLDAEFAKAELASYEGRFRDAIDHLDRAVKMASERGDLNSHLFESSRERKLAFQTIIGDIEGGLETLHSLDLSYSVTKPSAPIHEETQKAHLLAAGGRMPEAREILSRFPDSAVEAWPRQYRADYYFRTGIVDLHDNKPASATENIKKAMELWNSQSNSLQMFLAWTYIANGEYEKSRQLAEHTINHLMGIGDFRAFSHVMLHYVLARSFEGLGERKKAIKYYREFLRFWKDADSDVMFLNDAADRLSRLSS